MKAKQRLPFIDKIFLWINYGFGIALLISYLAPITDPRKFWIVAFFGLGYPLILLGNCILLLYWIFRQKKYFLVSTICILCGLGVLNNNIGFHSNSERPPSPRTIRVMTYNVHNFKKFGSKKDIPTKHEILALIEEQHPDIIGFQEFYSRNKGQYNMVDSIKQIMQSNEYYLEAFQKNADESIGMAIFSKLPIINRKWISLSNDKNDLNQCLYVDVKKDSSIVRLYSVHLQSISFDPQDYKYLDTVSKIKFNMNGTRHLGSKLKNAFLKRAVQVFKIKADAAQCPYPYIISGDFNDTPTSFAVNQMAKGMKNSFTERGFGLGRTYNGDFPNYQIDYIMVNRGFDVLNYNIIEKKLSDHYPVVCDLLLK